ncbi:MAG: carbohydrate ABC transporter permease [Actinomycetes bacterium]
MKSSVRLVTHGAVAVYAILCLLPLLWMAMSAFKDNGSISLSPLSLPTTLDFSVFRDAWAIGGIGQYAINSIIVTAVSTTLVLLVSSMAGFALSRLVFPGSRFILIGMVVGLLLPIQAYFIAQNQLFELVHLKDTRLALIVPYTAIGIPLAIWLIKTYVDTMPKELFEAARIDGASDLTVYRLIMVPLMRPALVTVGIFTALAAWNEFLLALLYVQDESLKTIPTGLLAFSSRYATDYRMLFAALTMVTLPLIIIYVVFNKRIVEGLTQGSVKG